MDYQLTTRQKIYLPFKRFFDILFSFIFIVVLSPLFIIISIGVVIDTKGFPIFRQRRIGRRNKEFLILKFRSMNVNTPRDVPTHLLENPDQYISKFGRFLRKSSIDEIPQLFNIFIGQMSFIGPRPILPEEMKVMTELEQEERQSMRPGITGWEAIHEGESNNRREMAMFDLYYIRNWSLKLDWLVFYKTFAIVLGFQRPDDSVRAPKMTDDQIVKED